jgi:uncharacterized damage-inducible protein DinB
MHRYRDLAPHEGLAPEVGRVFASLQQVRLGTILMMEGLDSAQLAWSPGPGANSIGTLATHIAESEAFWIVETIGGHPLPETRRELYRMEAYGDPRASQAPPAPNHFFLGILSDLRVETKEVLMSLDDADLEGKRVWRNPSGSPGNSLEVFTVRWILDHVLVHEAHHQGQMALMRRLLAAPPPPILAGPLREV